MTRFDNFKLSIAIPSYNEAENIPELLNAVSENISSFPNREIVIVNDGSNDATDDVLQQCARENPELRYISLSRNYGHQAALRAGMEHALGDCVICMDGDLQHPPELVGEMVGKWQQGDDIVNCIRQDQRTLPLFKRMTSKWFYRFLSAISGLELVAGSSDFRLLDRKVVDILNRLRQSDLFYRGIIPTLGFRTGTIEYVPNARRHGVSKYSFRKMVRLALNGVLSTSTHPLRLATYFAFATAVGALSFLAYVLYIYFVLGKGVPGWASTLAVVLIIGTMQLFVLGMIGEYLGQVLKETRRRPPYLIDETGEIPARFPESRKAG